MTSRQEQLEHIAALIAENILLVPAIGDEEEAASFATVQRVNRAGWTFETSAPLGHVLRHEGVVLSAAELQQAFALAHEFAAA